MTRVDELNRIALEVLDTHAENLETEFSTFEEFQDLFVDVFGNNLGSPNNLANLQNQFIDGTLRPEVRFVPSEALTDAQGISRGAAFDQQSQTILLSEDLDAAGIESSIEQEIGHWWDVQLNGDEDTTTVDGQPFDEGTAYAERFSEGANGDNVFSDLVYQNDFQTILVNGQETEVEFRKISTWNIQGNTFNNGQGNTLQAVLETMENPIPDEIEGNPLGNLPIEVKALQEVSTLNLTPTLEEAVTALGGNLNQITTIPADNPPNNPNATVSGVRYDFELNNNNYRLYVGDGGREDLATAIILRNPSEETEVEVFGHPTNRSSRGFLGVRTLVESNNPDEEPTEAFYFSVHADSGFGLNQNNNASQILDQIFNSEFVNGNRDNVFILGDFNRDIANGNDPAGNRNAAFGRDGFADRLVAPNDFTLNARQQPRSTLDYLFTEAENINNGIVLNDLDNAFTPAFPSDHFPVLYDDELNDRTDFIAGVTDADDMSLDLEEPNPSFTDIEGSTSDSDGQGFSIFDFLQPVTPVPPFPTSNF